MMGTLFVFSAQRYKITKLTIITPYHPSQRKCKRYAIRGEQQRSDEPRFFHKTLPFFSQNLSFVIISDLLRKVYHKNRPKGESSGGSHIHFSVP